MKFLSKNFFIYTFIFYFILIQLTYEEEPSFDFLEDKTIDNLRQIYWSGTQLLENETDIQNFENKQIFHLTKFSIKARIRLLSKELNKTYDYNTIIALLEENSIFKIKNENDIYNLINNEKIPKKFLINFAFNLDKYSRTEKQEINGASDYLNYLTRKQIKTFIFEKLEEYPILKSTQNFIKYILNNVYFKYDDIDDYLKTKTKKELIQIIYGFEQYCFSYDGHDSSDCHIAYHTYNHESLDTYQEDEIKSFLAIYKRRLNFKDLNDFISKIENHDFSYIYSDNLFSSIENSASLKENVKAFETYFNRKNNLEKSLTKLDSYIDNLNNNQLIDILKWGMGIFPELLERARFKDITSSQTNLQYGKVKEFLKTSKREELIKYAYNIHTYVHNITSKYDKNIIDLFRFNDIQLYSQIFNDTNKDIDLQEKKTFNKYASLFKYNFEKYIKSLQRNQLKLMTQSLINLHALKEGELHDEKKISERKNLFDSLEIMNNENLLNKCLSYAKALKIENIYNFIDMENVLPDYRDMLDNHYYSYFINIMDFFRSTDINYLRLWLRKYELEIRKIKSVRYLSGGLKDHFMNINEYTKQDLLKIFDIYVTEYPELFSPEKFIKITGLDNGYTPHKFLVENANNNALFEKIIFSITAYFEMKNIQINFDYTEYISVMLFDDIDYYIKNNFLYSIFRIINIFPELNNMIFFEKICINPETRIIDFSNESGLFYNSTRNYTKMFMNIRYYYEKTIYIGEDKPEIPKLSDSDQFNKLFIKSFLIKPFESEVKYRVLYGDFYTLFYDCKLYYADESVIVISNIYKSLYNNNYTNVKATKKDKQIDLICEAIKKFDELKDVSYFDSKYAYINIDSEKYNVVKKIYNFLKDCDNKQLFYYCLIANILKIEYEKKYEFLKEFENIYLKIHYMTRNAMIRYILDIARSTDDLYEQFLEANLRKLTKKYMLDIGSDNIYDLTMF